MKRPAAALLGCIAILLLLTVTGIASTPTVQTGTWQPIGSMMWARSGATAVLLEDHRVLIAGGDSGSGAVNSAEVYNADGSFSAVSAMGTARAKHVAVVLADGRVLVAGGESTGGGATNSAEIYDPATDGWTAVAGGMAEARSGATASLLNDGRVLIAGGQNGTTASGTIEIFDPRTGQFGFAGMMSSPRMGLASASLADGRVLITGGSNGSVPVASSDVFDPTTNTVSAGPAMTSPRQGHSATSLLDGRVLVAGGNNGSADLASAEIYDAGTGGFAPVASSLAAPRRDHAAILLPNNNSVLIVGGTSAGNELNRAETFAPWAGAFAVTGAASVARQHSAVSALNEDGLLLMAGGTSTGAPVSGAELYGFATVKTDAADYAPGSVVTIIGSGWQPGETVTLTLVESPLFDTHPVMTAVADGRGRFTNAEFSPDEHDIGIRFFLTAVGSQSGTQAQNTFTDAISVNKVFPVGTQTPSTVQGGSSATYAVTVTFNGSGSACTAMLGIGSPGLPSGVTATFSPNPVPSSDGNSTLTLTTTAGLTPVGSSTFQITATGTGASGCNGSAQTNPAGTGGNAANPTLTVSKTDQTILLNALANKASGDPDFAISATASSGLPVSFASLTTGVCTVSGSTVHLVSAGTCTIQASQSGNAFYNAALPVSQSFTVGKATPTIAWANPADITYGTALSATQLNAAASVAGTYVYTPAAGTVLNAGSGQTLHVDFTPTDPTNFGNASKDVTINVNKADAVITVTPYHVTYDGNAHTATGSAHGVESPAPVDLSGLLHLGGTTHTNAGDYATDGWTFDGNANYKSASGTVHDAIDQADAVITVNAYHVTYDGNTHAATGSAHGVESPAPVDLSGLLHLGGTAHINAGDYLTDSWTFDGNTNYKAASGTVHDLIDQADAVITVNAYHVTYDTNAHTATGSAHGVETPTPADLTSLLHLGGTAHTNAGDFTDSWTFDGNANYKAASGTVHDVIDKADALIGVTPYAGTYTGTAHTATGTAKGIGGVDLSAGLNLSGTTHTDAGDYPADPWSFTGGTNYNDATGTVHDHLDKADPNITATGGTFAYDGNAHAGSATAFGVLGESLSPVNIAYKDSANSLLTTAPVNAGNYSVAARYAGDNNYNPKQSAAASLTISKADAHITVAGYSLTYDATAHTATGTATGVESPAPADLTSLLHLNGTSHTDAGDFTDTWTFDGSENYNATSGTVHDHIEQANAAVNVTGYSVTYNAAPHTATGTATGVGGVNLGAGFNFSGTSHTDAGDYPLDSWSFSGGVNYKDQSGTVHDHIDKADASVAVTAYSVTYNGAPHTATGTATGVGAIDLSSGFNFTGTSHTDAGDYPNDPWSFAGGANYKDQSGTVHDHIDKAGVTATAGGGTATFDGTNKAPSNCAVTGAYTGDLTCTNNPASVGPNAGTTVIAAIVNGTGLSNYQISYVPGSFTIGKAASTTMLTFEAGPYVYRATAFTATAVATGPGGLSVPVTPVTYSGDCINVTAGGCTANASYGGDGNHNGSSGSLSIAITPEIPMISVAGVNTAFDGNPHAATGTAKGIGGVTVPGSFAFVYTPGGSAVPTLPGVYSALGTFTSGSPNYTSGGSGTASINIGYGVCTAGPGGVVLPPINSDGSSVYQRKGGSTIPVKFRVCAANGSAISNPAAVFAGTGGTLTMLSAVRGTINNINEADGTDIPDAAFRWDASGQQWIFNMATNNLSSGNTYLFRINLANGSIQFVVGVK